MYFYMYFKQNIFNIHIKISPFIIIFQYMCFSLYHPFQYILHTNKFIHIIVRIFSLLHILSNLPSHTYRHILISMRLCAIAHYIKRIGKHTNTPQDTSCTRL